MIFIFMKEKEKDDDCNIYEYINNSSSLSLYFLIYNHYFIFKEK